MYTGITGGRINPLVCEPERTEQMNTI